MIGWPTVSIATCAWVVLCCLFALLFWQHRHEHPVWLPFVVHVIGLLALVVFPLAAAPLALAWNRNR